MRRGFVDSSAVSRRWSEAHHDAIRRSMLVRFVGLWSAHRRRNGARSAPYNGSRSRDGVLIVRDRLETRGIFRNTVQHVNLEF